MNEILEQMGMRIALRRRQLRLTQEELSERAGVMPQTISSAERAKTALRPENIIRVSAALGVSTDYLLTGRVTEEDYRYLTNKLSRLTPVQYRHLEDIIDSYLAVLPETESRTE